MIRKFEKNENAIRFYEKNNFKNVIINMYPNIAKYILQCTLELHDIWNVQNVTKKVGKERL